MEFLFGSGGYLPHGVCLSWDPTVIAVFVLSNFLLGVSYISVASTITIFIHRRADFPYPVMMGLCAAVSGACGLTHFAEIGTLWLPLYGVEAFGKLIVALVSVATAGIMWKVLPHAMRLPSPSAMEKANRELATNQRFLRTITDNLPSIIGYWDRDFVCRFANKNYLNWFDRPLDEIVGCTMVDLLGEEGFAIVEPRVHRVLAGEAQAFERIMTKPNGEIRHTWIQYIPDFDDINQVRGFLVLVTDITHIKQSELRLRELNDELVAAKDKAEAANQAKSIFLANMSHELRTPLTSVIGFSQLMAEEGKLAPDQMRRLAIINRSGNHLLTLINDVLTLINDVLTLSKIEAGRVTLDEQHINIASMIEGVVEMIRSRSEQKGVALIANIPKLSCDIITDGIKIRQVLLNLLSNAVKFTEHGAITLNAVATPTPDGRLYLELSVTDTGSGIAAKDIDRVFEPFVQTGAVDKQGGTGLGLSISRQFVRMLGGRLTLTSELGKGSTFRFGFIVETCDPPNTPPPDRGRVIGVRSDGRIRRVLVADDNADIRLLLSTLLTRLGLGVSEAVDGIEALAAVRATAPDLVLMDWRMPKMDGIEAVRQIRVLPDIRQPPIIMLTASAFEEQRLVALATGADDFLRKPLALGALHGMLETHLNIRFVREDQDEAPPRSPSATTITTPPLTANDLAPLSKPKRAELAEAVGELNLSKLAEALTPVSREHPDLAARIRDLADSGHYRELWSLLEGHDPEDNLAP